MNSMRAACQRYFDVVASPEHRQNALPLGFEFALASMRPGAGTHAGHSVKRNSHIAEKNIFPFTAAMKPCPGWRLPYTCGMPCLLVFQCSCLYNL